MERKEFLDRCRLFARLPKGVHQQPDREDPAVLVRCRGAALWPVGYRLWFTEGTGEIRHTAVLRERNANSVREVPLEEVESFED